MNRVDRRRMDKMRDKINVRKRLTGRLGKNQLRRAGHLVWMEEETMANNADGFREQSRKN